MGEGYEKSVLALLCSFRRVLIVSMHIVNVLAKDKATGKTNQ